MAVEKIPTQTVMRLRFQTGVDGEGNPKYLTKSLSNVKHDSVDEDIYDTALVLADLQEHDLSEIHRIDTAGLHEIG